MKCRIGDEHWLMKTPVAHRGLHAAEKGIPENSFKAYAAAIEKGYPIEMDVQLTKDNKLVCFHDDNLKRVTGEDSLIWDKTLDEVENLRLSGTDEKIPTFDEFLSFIDGRVPIVIELKSQRTKGVIADEVIKRLDGYKGEFVVQSFDPFIMKEFRVKRPDFMNMNVVYIPVSTRMRKNKRLITWTIRTEEDKAKAMKYADNYIFENIRP